MGIIITELLKLLVIMKCPKNGYEIIEKLKNEMIRNNCDQILIEHLNYYLTNITHILQTVNYENDITNEMNFSQIFNELKSEMSEKISDETIEKNEKIKKISKKNNKLKKNDQLNDLNPERWLPKYERSYYKPDKKKKRNLQCNLIYIKI